MANLPKFWLPILLLCVVVPPIAPFLLAPEGGEAPSPPSTLRHRKPTFRPQQIAEANRNPIVLIPGDGGSRLRANLTGKPSVVHYFCERHTTQYFDLWLNLQQFGPFVIDCWADNMRLGFNASTGRAQELDGVRVHVPGLGNTNTVEWLDASKRAPGRYFAPIVDLLTTVGYRRGLDVAGAPYDWRKAPKDLTRFYARLRRLIEAMCRANGNRKVIILAHSMGNPVANYFYHTFVDQAWKDQFLEAHIALAGAWGGAAQIVKLFASGYNMDYYRVLLPPSRLRAMQRSFTSSALLFPSMGLWDGMEVLASRPSRNYSLSNLAEFFGDIEYPQGMAQWQSVHPTLLLGAPGVKFRYHDWMFPNYQPYIGYGNGDGTVNIRSLEVCARWNAENNGGKGVEIQRLKGTDHMGILSDAQTLTLLARILREALAKS